jgi:hypothetical protein
MSVADGLDKAAPLLPDRTAAWVAKGRRLSEAALPLAGAVADPAPVEPHLAAADEWPFGAFMVAWLDGSGPVRHVCHLPDASFFLRLLDRVYAGAFARQPGLSAVLRDQSRLEMSLTNDTLQLQLADGLGLGYSMIRHHALMLFIAALWLDEPQRSAWLSVYDEVVTYVDSRPGGRPALSTVADVEAAAFADFVTLAPETLDPRAATALLGSSRLDAIVEYQLLAAAAIGLLWRDFRRHGSEAERTAWLTRQLSECYRSPDCLNELWTEVAGS